MPSDVAGFLGSAGAGLDQPVYGGGDAGKAKMDSPEDQADNGADDDLEGQVMDLFPDWPDGDASKFIDLVKQIAQQP